MSLSGLQLSVQEVTKRFTRKPIFAPVSFSAEEGEIVALCGANGSGKSTLLKMIAGLVTPSSGKVEWKRNDIIIGSEDLSSDIGFVAPYLELYRELTAIEHVQFVAELKDIKCTKDEALSLLIHFGLQPDIASSSLFVGQYSSGMKQRVALAMAAVGDPAVFLLDEPSATLDAEGVSILFSHIQRSVTNGKLVIIATNDENEKQLAHRVIELQPYTA